MKHTKKATVLLLLFNFLHRLEAYGPPPQGSPDNGATEYNHPQWGGVDQPDPPGSNRNGHYGSSGPRPRDGNKFKRENYRERYGFPQNCVTRSTYKHDCNYYVEISKFPESDFLHFELSTHIKYPQNGGYVGVGLSKDQKMGDDDIIECVLSASGGINMYHSWVFGGNRRSRNPVRLEDNGQIFETEETPSFDRESKRLTCRFRRHAVTYVNLNRTAQPIEINLIDDQYYILLAVGALQATPGDRLAYHGDNPIESGAAYASNNHLGYSYDEFPPAEDEVHPDIRSNSATFAIAQFLVFISTLIQIVLL